MAPQQIKCESCDQMYPASKSRCPHCGAKRSAPKRGGLTTNTQMLTGLAIVGVLIIVVIIIVVISLNSMGSNGEPVDATPVPDTNGIDSVTTPPDEDPAPLPESTVNIETIVFMSLENGTSLQLPVGAQFPLNDVENGRGLVYDPPVPEGETVYPLFISSNTDIATVHPSTGNIIAVSEGTCTITVSVQDAKREAIITVVPVGSVVSPSPNSSGAPISSSMPAGTIKLSHTDVSIKENESFILKANGGTDGVYYSSDTSIATINEDTGEVSGVAGASGKNTTIIVTLNGATGECIVRIR